MSLVSLNVTDLTGLRLGDSKVFYFGDSDDVSIKWDGTNFKVLPVADDTGAFHIGDGTTDFDVKVFLGNTSNYVLFDVGNQRLDIQGTGMKFQLGTFSSVTAGSGTALSASNTGTFRVYSDDAGASIASAQFVRGGVFRTLMAFVGTQECEAAGVIGQLVTGTGITLNHNDAGTWGSWEVGGSSTVIVDGTSQDNIHAGVLGRVGKGSGGSLTINTNGVLAAVAAMSNVNSSGTFTQTGKFVGFYAGGWASTTNFAWGLYAEKVVGGAYFNANAGTISGEVHGIDLVYTGTLSSGDSMVGGNFAVTTAGTAGTWVSGIYAKVVQGATKNVNGYLCGAEFEVVNSANNVSDNFVLVLNSNNAGAQVGSHQSYIALREYGATKETSFLWFGDQSIGSASTATMLSSTADKAATHTIRFLIGGTPYWILCNSAGPS